MCLGVFLLGSNFFGTLQASWTFWKPISYVRLGKFSFIICSNKCSIFCSSSSPPGTLMIRIWEVPKPLLIFLNSCFFILFWLNVSFFLLVHTIDLSPSFLLVTVGSLYFSFISLSIAFIFSSNLWPNSTNSVSFLITSVLNCASDRLAISSLLSCIFSGTLICYFIWAIFFFLS